MIPDVEQAVGAHLREHADIVALDARVASRTPSSMTRPWVRVTLLDAANDADSTPEHLLNWLLQFDCYAGADRDTAQAEANLLVRTVRAVLDAMKGQVIDGVVISNVRFVGMLRLPDTDLEPAKERYVLTAQVWAHA